MAQWKKYDYWRLVFDGEFTQAALRAVIECLSKLKNKCKRQKPLLLDFACDYGDFQGKGAFLHLLFRKKMLKKNVHAGMLFNLGLHTSQLKNKKQINCQRYSDLLAH